MLRVMIIIALIFSAVINLTAQKYYVNQKSQNEIKFISDAAMETVIGTTDNIDGYLELDNTASFTGSKIYFEVELNSLDTGLELRNKHLRKEYLHTEKYPAAYFEGKIISEKSIGKDTSNVTSEGTFFLHGKKIITQISGTIIKNNATFNLKSNFSINLKDYGIKIPTVMFMKVNEEIQIVMNLHLK